MITMDKILTHPFAPFELCDSFVRTMEMLAPSKALVVFLDERLDRAVCAVVIFGDGEDLTFSPVTILSYDHAQSPKILCNDANSLVVRYETDEGIKDLDVRVDDTAFLTYL